MGNVCFAILFMISWGFAEKLTRISWAMSQKTVLSFMGCFALFVFSFFTWPIAVGQWLALRWTEDE